VTLTGLGLAGIYPTLFCQFPTERRDDCRVWLRGRIAVVRSGDERTPWPPISSGRAIEFVPRRSAKPTDRFRRGKNPIRGNAALLKRRTGLNTSSPRLVGTLTLILSLSPAIASAMPQAGTVQVWLAAAAVGDDGQSDVTQADDLIRQARKAMAEGHLQLADSCTSRAEALNPKYSIFHIGDTPAKCRQDLNKRLGIRSAPGDRAPASATAASGKSSNGAPKDPFLNRHDSDASAETASPAGPAAGSNDRGPMRLPPVDSSAAAPAPWNSQAAANYPSTGEPPLRLTPRATSPATPKAQSDALLLSARKALAVGDVQRAISLTEQAKRLQANYGATDDSPARVGTLVRKCSDLASQSNRADSDAYRHQYAALLMEESEGLLRWREFDEAERLAMEAKKVPVQYNPIETRPDSLLERIASERHQGGLSKNTEESRLDVAAEGGSAASNSLVGRTGPATANKRQAQDMTRQARAALAQGDVARAEQLARQADGLAPDTAFSGQEDRPSLVLLDIQRARVHGNSGVVTAGGDFTADAAGRHYANQSIYDPNNDPTHVVAAGNEEPIVRPLPLPPTSGPGRDPAAIEPSNDGAPPAVQAFRQGERALADGNRDEALRLFRQAYANPEQLDPSTRQRLQDHLQMMSPAQPPRGPGDGLLDAAAARQQLLVRQVAADVSRLQETSRKMQAKEPRKALEVLQKARAMVETTADLEPQARQQLLRRVDESIHEMQQYIQANVAQIELDEKNRTVHEEVDQHRKMKLEISEKLAGMVDDYNKLVEERRYPEAELVAKRAAEMDPENPVVVQMVVVSKALRRQATDLSIKDEKEEAIVDAFQEVDKSTVPFHGEPYQMPDKFKWEQLTKVRGQLADDKQRRSAGDLEIEQKLTTPVSLKFRQAALGEVLGYLQKVTQVNMYVDPQGLQAEGVTTDQQVTIDLSRDIQLKSALALILEPLHLSYIVKDEVLKITSEDKRHGQVYTKSYPVADLVIPIPNFGPNGREGINGALWEAYNRLGWGEGSNGAFAGAPSVMAVASDTGAKTNAMLNPAVAAQMRTLGIPGTGQVQTGQPQPNQFGPGGLKGGNQADFDSLIELITSTISPTTWTDSGGTGSIAPFETNLTLVVSQTQEVHEQIADLLQQLRRLQDLQVTIEVRFITLSDNFFEQIGVNFNFNIPSSTSGVSSIGSKHIPSQVVGYGDIAGNPTAPQAIGFGQNPALPVQYISGSFQAATVPQFPGLTLDSTPTTFGFAILSDIEAFFLIQAFQGDTRSNVLQAPKVTLFNGQQAFVSDTSQRPFVTSVIPVVGDFAAAQQPVITVLSEGTSLTVQAVVSPDRRFVRLTVVPFFSQIGDVQEFTFTGSKTTTTNSANSTGGTDNTTSNAAGSTVTTEGTTVQLPTFNFVTVTTTVSVPDGGTVLLGGIKRLSEGRNERGVPVLSKIPYINRLFKNVGIGRTTSSLMMMVTPRIIIQEEEEQKLLGGTQP
jgi:general secretion pathway protein D